MYLIIGTVPQKDFPLVTGPARLEKDRLIIHDQRIRINRGTPALLAAAIKTAETLGQPMPHVVLVGDTGIGNGSRKLYAWLEAHITELDPEVMTFHYLQPDVDWHNRIIFAVQEMKHPPVLIADAGFMYAAKLSGMAETYRLFTPDVGELAFLADEEAPHPFYTRGFILHEESRVPELIHRAYAHHNAAEHLLVKGAKDYVVRQNTILKTIDGPNAEAMEAMGGTGDTLTGIVTSLVAAGRNGSKMNITKACETAARINRFAGFHADPTPASQVMEIVAKIPKALESVLSCRSKTNP